MGTPKIYRSIMDSYFPYIRCCEYKVFFKIRDRIMFHKKIMNQHRIIGRFAAWAVSFLGVAYAIALVLGLLSLKSSQDPIGDPIFTILELIILLMAPLLVISMVTVHAYASPDVKVYSLTALVFMILLAGITSSVHFVILTVSRQIEATELTWVSLLLSFK